MKKRSPTLHRVALLALSLSSIAVLTGCNTTGTSSGPRKTAATDTGYEEARESSASLQETIKRAAKEREERTKSRKEGT
ncbi:hypothetical protein [Actomonas aquatica]|uniref:Secreted protein n=1 Tax=Actomonas aquatica TaxID=2866162 RepID=A0ABZ1C4L4_9BACT|nr:hypothetical protein [Opitutus sp. WL0086]WRQ86666.1 hypothetical protein K1X11_017780 [Opitutus sp. WL0086]